MFQQLTAASAVDVDIWCNLILGEGHPLGFSLQLVRQVCSMISACTLDLREVHPSQFHGLMAMCKGALLKKR